MAITQRVLQASSMRAASAWISSTTSLSPQTVDMRFSSVRLVTVKQASRAASRPATPTTRDPRSARGVYATTAHDDDDVVHRHASSPSPCSHATGDPHCCVPCTHVAARQAATVLLRCERLRDVGCVREMGRVPRGRASLCSSSPCVTMHCT